MEKQKLNDITSQNRMKENEMSTPGVNPENVPMSIDEQKMMMDKGYREQAQFYCNTVEQKHVDGHTVYPVDFSK